MSRSARFTLAVSAIFAVGTIWGVHFLQQRERKTMYAGVIRDDARRKEKMQERQEKLEESMRKFEAYEQLQPVPKNKASEG